MFNWKKNAKKVAQERIKYLFELVKTKNNNSYESSLKKNALKLIYKIRLRYNIRLSQTEKMSFCKFCFNPYKHPKIRFRKIKKNKETYLQKIIICENCGKEQRFTIKNKN